jgi:pimeloyl-ACP methyl ester carboxylesterase
MRPELGRVTAPLLVVHDRADPLSPVIHADQLGQLVPDCRMCWYDTGSHRPHLAAPERFAVDVRAFWQEVSSG